MKSDLRALGKVKILREHSKNPNCGPQSLFPTTLLSKHNSKRSPITSRGYISQSIVVLGPATNPQTQYQKDYMYHHHAKPHRSALYNCI